MSNKLVFPAKEKEAYKPGDLFRIPYGQLFILSFVNDPEFEDIEGSPIVGYVAISLINGEPYKNGICENPDEAVKGLIFYERNVEIEIKPIEYE